MAKSRIKWLQFPVHIGALVPLAWLLLEWFAGRLSVNPIQDATLRTGKPALVLLVLTLSITPLGNITGLSQLIPLRKWLGLYAFLYAFIHFLIFVGLDYGFDLLLLREAIFEKRFALAGFASLITLAPLALTSTVGWMRRMGRRWKRLHRLAYVAGILASVHFLWLVKSDIREPLAYGALIAGLLVLRIPAVRRMAGRLRFGLRKLRTRSHQPDAERVPHPAMVQPSRGASSPE